jgi:hypothetical protein
VLLSSKPDSHLESAANLNTDVTRPNRGRSGLNRNREFEEEAKILGISRLVRYPERARFAGRYSTGPNGGWWRGQRFSEFPLKRRYEPRDRADLLLRRQPDSPNSLITEQIFSCKTST